MSAKETHCRLISLFYQLQILGNKIRQNKNIQGIQLDEKELKLLQYADDTNGILKNIRSAKHFLDTVEIYGNYSGFKLNKEKTEGMWLGRFQNSLSKPLNINWPDAPLRILGIYASYDSDTCIIKNFKEKLANIKAIINIWKGRN